MLIGAITTTTSPAREKGCAVRTPAERDVARLIAGGYSNAEIACTHAISSNTVKAHTRSIYATIGVSNRAEAVAFLCPLDT